MIADPSDPVFRYGEGVLGAILGLYCGAPTAGEFDLHLKTRTDPWPSAAGAVLTTVHVVPS